MLAAFASRRTLQLYHQTANPALYLLPCLAATIIALILSLTMGFVVGSETDNDMGDRFALQHMLRGRTSTDSREQRTSGLHAPVAGRCLRMDNSRPRSLQVGRATSHREYCDGHIQCIGVAGPRIFGCGIVLMGQHRLDSWGVAIGCCGTVRSVPLYWRSSIQSRKAGREFGTTCR
nr:hypothetical protein B0A51_10510 [Rachicladosporium sp. CCFEE 5018]